MAGGVLGIDAAASAALHWHHDLPIGVKCLLPGSGAAALGAAHRDPSLGIVNLNWVGGSLLAYGSGETKACPKLEHPQDRCASRGTPKPRKVDVFVTLCLCV